MEIGENQPFKETPKMMMSDAHTIHGTGIFTYSKTHKKSTYMDPMGVSLNGGTPKSSIFFGGGVHYFHHPFWGTTILGNPQIVQFQDFKWFTLTESLLTVGTVWHQGEIFSKTSSC